MKNPAWFEIGKQRRLGWLLVSACVLLTASCWTARASLMQQAGTPASTAAPATGIVDPSQVHQEIFGFGASEAYYQGYLAKHPHSKEIYDALFGPENGLHIDILRLRDTFEYDEKPGFDRDTVDIVKHANALRSQPLTIMMSSWSPPASLKSNNSEKDGGTLVKKDGQYDYAGYAQYWKDSLLAYRAAGINPTYISFQNEPDQTVPYESCRFNPTEAPYHGDTYAGYDKALDAVYKVLQQMPSPPRLIGPEVIGIGYGRLRDFVNAANPDELYAISHHYYTGGDKKQPDTYIPLMKATEALFRGKLLFQTEYYTPGGFESVMMIEDGLAVENLGMYLYWPLTWIASAPTLLVVEDPADPSKWKNPQGWAYTDAYYALKQFSYFIHPGYHRVDAASDQPDVRLSAYLSPKQDKLVVVAINTSRTLEHSVKFELAAFAQGRSRLYRTTFKDPADPAPGENFANLGALKPGSLLTLPPHSIATLEITR